MAANIELRLRFGDAYIVVRESSDTPGDYTIEILGHMGEALDTATTRAALVYLRACVSQLRAKIHNMILALDSTKPA